jgi:hypothetical protein
MKPAQNRSIAPVQKAPKACRHRPLHGPYVSAQHLVVCLGVPRQELLEACAAGQLDFTLMPNRHARTRLRVSREQAVIRWPEQLQALVDDGVNSVRRGTRPNSVPDILDSPSSCARARGVTT